MQTPVEFALQNGIANEETIVLAKTKLVENYHKIIEVLKDYIDTTEENYKIIALWIIGTYFHEKFEAYPYLFFNAMRGSGKSRMLKLISSLAAKGDGSVQNNLTEAVLFRVPRGTTTCIDEIEQINSKEKQTLRELLNSAYKKGTKIKRMRKAHTKDGEAQVTETFEPYFPIALCNIYGVEEVLGDRSLVLILEKSTNPRNVMKIEDFLTNDTIGEIRRELNRVSVVCAVSLQEKTYIGGWNQYINDRYTYTTLTTLTTQTTSSAKIIELEEFYNKIHDLGIYGRNFELFFPLLIIAKMIDDEVFNEFTKIASSFVSRKKEDEFSDSKDVSLYEFIATIEESHFVSVKDLANRFRLYMGESDEEDKWLNDKWLGRALKRLNLVIDKRRMASGRFVTLNIGKAKEKLKIFQTTK